MADRRWPNLFLAGAAKAGTTSLHRYLDEHPEIAMSDEKETYFFSKTLDKVEEDAAALVEAEDTYLDNFAHAGDESYLGESTPGYLWHTEVPRRIAERVDEPRLIFSFRDPVERAHSDWAMAVQRTGETRSLVQRVQDELEQGGDGPIPHGVVNPGLYATHLERHIETFGRERLHVILFEDLKEDPLTLLEGIARFLGIDEDAMHDVDYETVHNPGGAPRNRVARWLKDADVTKTLAEKLLHESTRVWLGEHVLVETKEKPPLEPEAVDLLAGIYEPEIEKLESILERELPQLRGSWSS